LPHARNLASRGVIPGGTERNLQAATRVEWSPDLSLEERYLCVDAQTSGGLLLVVPSENETALLAALREEHTPAAAIIGRIVAGEPGTIRVLRRHP
jgi:selenide, water dikinase